MPSLLECCKINQGLTPWYTTRVQRSLAMQQQALDRATKKKLVYRLIDEMKAISAIREELSSISDDEIADVTAADERKLNQLSRLMELANESLTAFYFEEVNG